MTRRCLSLAVAGGVLALIGVASAEAGTAQSLRLGSAHQAALSTTGDDPPPVVSRVSTGGERQTSVPRPGRLWLIAAATLVAAVADRRRHRLRQPTVAVWSTWLIGRTMPPRAPPILRTTP